MDTSVESQWFSIMERYKNSVLQLICVRGVYDPFRPQLQPRDKKSRGTGFILDISRGLVLTNAHVCTNAITISGRMVRFGERDFRLNLVSICREKDIALCQLVPEDIAVILDGKSPNEINMIFGDNMQLKETSNVVAIGYPLGQKNIKFTTGVVSGFHAFTEDDNGENKTPEEEPSYIQITAPINPGNSGGPLVNTQGEVVGVNAAGFMFSQNVSYAIGSRTVLGIYDELIRPLTDRSIKQPYRLITAKYAFEYNRASPDLLEITCGRYGREGIYVRRVYPNSCFDTLAEGDIISEVIYSDVYLNNPAAFNVIDRKQVSGTETRARVDKFGDVTINSEDAGLDRRKLAFNEFFDMIPMNSPVSLIICRFDQGVCSSEKCGRYQISTTFKFIPSTVRYSLYPRITPYQYLIVAGISLGELTANHIDSSDLEEYMKGKKRYQQALVVNQIFPETTAYSTRVFEEGDIIVEVNDQPVTTIKELKRALKTKTDYLSLVGRHRSKFVISRTQAKSDKKHAQKLFALPK